MRWLVVGAGGMLGRDAAALLRARGHEIVTLRRSELDIVDSPAVDVAVRGFEVVLNCAAWTAVDAAEDAEAAAFGPNAVGAANLAGACAASGARLVHISTDYVFDGTASVPYAEDAPVAPRSAYGRTKAAGEWAVRAGASTNLVVRTAWLYGAGGPCFPRTIAALAADRGSVSVVEDQVGQPTWTSDVADFVERLVVAGVPGGTYHATASGAASWYEFARAVVDTAGMEPSIVTPTTSDAFVRPAPRPSWSVLGHGASDVVGVEAIGTWSQRWAVAGREVLG
ncbi:NAD(P)-dependent oxidoreductase [Paraoerskovia sediminicola]|uniref:dTDP-4-dehydrorhamnose reductase n=1 Tax=Paraoerskovia sediminicola TaxID=1138587 RepID=A0ABN6XDL4_9CELL|nr:dTDP-4-dehydrorhamnose reductase [Paraoerskovia sediminicola]BDZ42845.1 NAD(P)-dependent oxidoreductase [Paraoerskovia sediminicola]